MTDRSRLPNEIWMADLLAAWKACGAATPEDRLMAASLLGFTKRSAAVAERLRERTSDSERAAQKPLLRQTEVPRADTRPMPRDLAARLVIVDRRMSPAMAESGDAPGPALPLETDAHIRYEPPLEPLFEAQYQRQILYALGATMAAEGDFDIEPLVGEISSGRPLLHAPRKPVLTLRRGVQLLLDRGDGLTPFFGDQRALLTALRRLIGPERLQFLHFSECPIRGAGTGSRRRWARYQPPPARTKVVVVSDFGISRTRGLQRPSTAAEWLDFAALVRGAECDLIGLVPYPPRRWPRAIAAAMKLVQWDRPTRFSVVRERSLPERQP